MRNELNEKELTQVSGGVGGENQVSIDLDIPQTDGNVIIKVYVDGVNDKSKTTVVNPNLVSHQVFTFSGSGIIQVKFKFSTGKIYNYQIDFDNGTATRN